MALSARSFHSTSVLSSKIPKMPDADATFELEESVATHTEPELLVSGTPEDVAGRKVVIYRPTKNAMQSRGTEASEWAVTFEPTVCRRPLCVPTLPAVSLRSLLYVAVC